MSLLDVQEIDVYYGDLLALRGVSLSVEKGQVVAVLGPNGAGKSTLLRTISGIVRYRSGHVALEGQALDGIPPHKVADIGIAHVPEGRRIFADLTVKENLLLGSYRSEARKVRQESLSMTLALFPRLAERQGQLGGTLSGGEQQMLAIGRALMAQPKVLLLDEPSMGLAPMLVAQIFEIISEINGQGTTILLVEQNAAQALQRAHRAYVLETGNVVKSGPASELLHDEAVKAAYLGGDVSH